MKSYADLARSVQLKTTKYGAIEVKSHHSDLLYIDVGRSAAVFRIKSTNLALKVFLPHLQEIAHEEASIYHILSGISYYPRIYDSGENYLVIDFIEGTTLFNCLTRGIFIKEQTIEEVDYALYLARNRGLNPSDIHLRNIIVTPNDEVKLIDVARFKQSKKCTQWKDLKRAYYGYYVKELWPKKLSSKSLNTIALLYHKKLLKPLVKR